MVITKKKWTDWINSLNNTLKCSKDYYNDDLNTIINKDKDNLWGIYRLDMLKKKIFPWDKEHHDNILNILQEYLFYNNIYEYISISSPSEYVLKKISEIFIKKPSKIWQQNELKIILNGALELAKKQLTTSTHFIPIQLPKEKKPKCFFVGGIQILPEYHFFDVISDCIHTYNKKASYKNFVNDLGEYFEKFSWVAKIEISNCNTKIANSKALHCEKLLTAFISLFFEHGFIKYIIKEKNIYKKEVSLFIHDNIYNIEGNIQFSDFDRPHENWTSIFEDESFLGINEIFKNIIHKICSCELLPNLSSKYIQALEWYWDALNENDKGASIIKLAISLESLIPNINKNELDKSNITQQFAQWIYFFVHEQFSKKEIKRFYEMRSRLTHGSNTGKVYAQNNEVVRTLDIGIQITQTCLKTYLLWIGEESVFQDPPTDIIHEFYEKHIKP